MLPTLKVNMGKRLSENVLLDSGSSVSLINEDMYKKLKSNNLVKEIKEVNVSCKSAINNNIDIMGQCSIKVRIHNFSWNVECLIARNLVWKVILGSDFIKNSNMVLDLSSDTCYFKFSPETKIDLNNNPTVISANVNKDIVVGCNKASNEIRQLIQDNPSVFTSKIGEAIDFEVDLKLKDSEPVKQKCYPLSPPKNKIMKDIVDDLLKQNIIRPSLSSYASPSFLVKKPNSDKYRLVINYNALNKKIEQVNYPIGDLHELYHYLRDSEYFTVLDLTQSFHQIKIAENSRHITAFTTNYESYEWNRLPFGLHSGSGILSSYLNRVFKEEKFKFVLNFVDDLIVYSKDLEEHLSHLKQVTEKLKLHNLTVNPSKAVFASKQISFLGYLISKNQVTIDPDRTIAIKNSKPPRDVKGVSRFIGMTSYFSKFIPEYSKLAACLNELRKKNKRFYWSEECQSSFDKLKEAIINPPVLAIPDYNLPFILQCDASDRAAGAVLLQENNGETYPVAYYSKKFSDSEKCLSVYHKEALAVVNAINKFRNYLEHKKFTLVTDNSALAWVLGNFRKLGKLGRWVETILSLPFEIQHVKGKDNAVADFLSRHFEAKEDKVDDSNDFVNNVNKCKDKYEKKMISSEVKDDNACNLFVNSIKDFPLSFSDFKSYQNEDKEVSQIIDSVNKGTNNERFSLNKGVLMHQTKDNSVKKIFLPKKLFDMVFKYFHDSFSGCHLGVYKTIKKITEYFYMPHISEEVKARIKSCELCNKGKPSQKVFQGPLVSSNASTPMERLYIDVFGPLTRSKTMNNNLLIIVDQCTKFVWLYAMRNAKSKTIVNILENFVFKNFGLCKELISDNAKCFVSSELKNFLFNKGIIHKTIIPYVPRSNISERYLRNIKAIFQIYFHNCQDKWDCNLSEIQLALNSACNEATKFTPHELMFSFKINSSLSNVWGLNDVIEEKVNARNLAEKLNQAISNNKSRNKLNTNLLKYNEENSKYPFKKNSIVYLKTYHLSNKVKKFQGKTALRFEGPYKILIFISDVSCIVQKLNDPNIVKRVHVSQLKAEQG